MSKAKSSVTAVLSSGSFGTRPLVDRSVKIVAHSLARTVATTPSTWSSRLSGRAQKCTGAREVFAGVSKRSTAQPGRLQRRRAPTSECRPTPGISRSSTTSNSGLITRAVPPVWCRLSATSTSRDRRAPPEGFLPSLIERRIHSGRHDISAAGRILPASGMVAEVHKCQHDRVTPAIALSSEGVRRSKYHQNLLPGCVGKPFRMSMNSWR